MKTLIYLASPYSHEDSEVRELRFRAVCYAASILIQRGYQVFSPIAHSHPIARCLGPDCELDLNLWLELDKRMLAACDELVVLTLDGWLSSKGIAAEIEIAKRQNKAIRYFSPISGFVDEALQN